MTQPEALRMADLLERMPDIFKHPIDKLAAAELRRLYAENEALRAKETTPQQAAPAVGNSGFDYKTAADFLNGKSVISDEAIRKFVAASRAAHDDRAGLQATLQSVRGELASREAEIAMLKKALMDGEAAPQQAAPAEPNADPIRALIAQHAATLDQNESAYFELCYHRTTGWMAWITDKPLCMPPVVNPDRKVLAQGQGDTADEACRDAAINAARKEGK